MNKKQMVLKFIEAGYTTSQALAPLLVWLLLLTQLMIVCLISCYLGNTNATEILKVPAQFTIFMLTWALAGYCLRMMRVVKNER